MTKLEMLQDALEHEEKATKLYRKYARATEDERIREMFEQFAMNENWHAAALRSKIDDEKGEGSQ
ncbi:MAG: ferritin family protein [Planctomycetota bacterium]